MKIEDFFQIKFAPNENFTFYLNFASPNFSNNIIGKFFWKFFRNLEKS